MAGKGREVKKKRRQLVSHFGKERLKPKNPKQNEGGKGGGEGGGSNESRVKGGGRGEEVRSGEERPPRGPHYRRSKRTGEPIAKDRDKTVIKR